MWVDGFGFGLGLMWWVGLGLCFASVIACCFLEWFGLGTLVYGCCAVCFVCGFFVVSFCVLGLGFVLFCVWVFVFYCFCLWVLGLVFDGVGGFGLRFSGGCGLCWLCWFGLLVVVWIEVGYLNNFKLLQGCCNELDELGVVLGFMFGWLFNVWVMIGCGCVGCCVGILIG